MTNCVRHAKAHEIKILLAGGASDLHISVADDGVGIDPARQRDGLGLRGIDERVKELGGTMTLASGVGRGTTLTIRLPLPAAAETEEPLARAVS
jgi:signal transduction histidine kinase